MKKLLSILTALSLALVLTVSAAAYPFYAPVFEPWADVDYGKYVSAVYVGPECCAAIAGEESSLYMWGKNQYGQLGNGTTNDCKVPVKIMDNVDYVLFGSTTTAAVTRDRTLYIWGDNYEGQLGNGLSGGIWNEYDEGIDSCRPVKVLEDVDYVTCIYGYSYAAITTDGSLYMWGRDCSFSLCNEYPYIVTTPVRVMDNVYSFTSNEYGETNAVITRDGKLYMWGQNQYGQVGAGYVANKIDTPTKILDDVTCVSLGDSHSGAVTVDGSLYMWGDNYCGQLGNGRCYGAQSDYDSNLDSNLPIKIMDGISSVLLCGDNTAAVADDGSLYMWGDNYRGQLGNGKHGGKLGKFDPSTDENKPYKVMDQVESVYISVAFQNLVAAKTYDNSLYTWGDNFIGRTENKLFPEKLMDNVFRFFDSGDVEAIITNNNQLYMWGYGYRGTIGNGIREDSQVPVLVLNDVICFDNSSRVSGATTMDGALYMWGYNLNGMVGDGTNEDSLIPKRIIITDARRGDLNSSGGNPDVSDGVVMQRILASLEPEITAADLNHDGIVNVADGVTMQRILAGLEA